MTKQRALVLQIVQAAEEHLTAEQIFLEAKKQMPTIALATIYNSLNYLCENRYIEKIGITGQTDRYDKMFVRHDHRLCDRCGGVSDIIIDGMKEFIEEKIGEPALTYELTVHHLCPNCRAAANS